MVVCWLRDVSSKLDVYSLATGALQHHVPLPGIGSVAEFSGRRQESEWFFKFTGFTEPGAIYRCECTSMHHMHRRCCTGWTVLQQLHRRSSGASTWRWTSTPSPLRRPRCWCFAMKTTLVDAPTRLGLFPFQGRHTHPHVHRAPQGPRAGRHQPHAALWLRCVSITWWSCHTCTCAQAASTFPSRRRFR